MKKPDVKATVVYLRDGLGRVGVAQKKQAIHHDGAEISYSLGTYSGHGGKREPEDETIFHTAIRELEAESGVRGNILDLEHLLRVHFYVRNKETGNHDPYMTVSFFFLQRWFGTPSEGREMGPTIFFDPDLLPYKEMMPADEELLRKMFAGEKGVYEVKLNGKNLPFEIRELEEFLEEAVE